ncbi:hypothetical protein GGI14_001284 [Coemansia sp. S680]|nr:hypothetical protein GGI14_001284 [Coemansia sp. S680]
MCEPVARLQYALTFRNTAGIDITKVFGGRDEPKYIRMWLSRNLKREFLEKGIIKSKDATLTLMWSIPKDKQQGKPLGSNTLGPLHNIEGTVKANRDYVDFSKGLCVIVRDFAVTATENEPVVNEDEPLTSDDEPLVEVDEEQKNQIAPAA